MAKCGESCLKCFVILLHSIFIVIGLGLISLSIVGYFIYLHPISTSSVYFDHFKLFLYSLSGLGCLGLLIGFLGCCGACFESRCLLTFSYLCALFIFGFHAATTIVGFSYSKEWKEAIGEHFKEEMQSYQLQWQSSQENIASLKNASFYIDFIQKQVSCCGSTGPQSYNNRYKLPPSCCRHPIPSKCSTDFVAYKDAYEDGCQKAYTAFVEKHATFVLIALCFISVVEFVSLFFTMKMCCTIGRVVERYAEVHQV